MSEPTARTTCWTCRKPTALCLCAQIPKVHNKTPIVVLQHRKERNHPLGTARFIRLGLARQAQHFLLGQNGASEPVDLPEGAALLYPSDDAVDLAGLDPAEAPTALVILDATWPLAHQLYRDNPWIRALPHVRITPAAPSRYRIRPEPQPDYVSTLEAALGALLALEPELEGVEALLSSFDQMIDAQIAAADHKGRPRPRRLRRRPSRTFPAELEQTDAVVAYIEPGPRESGDTQEPIHWAAVRGSDGAAFDRVVQASPPPNPRFWRSLDLDESCLDAQDFQSIEVDFRAFIGEATTVFCWNRTTHDFVQQRWPDLTVMRLKPVWTNHLRTRFVSHLEEIVAGLSLEIPELSIRGRAGERLALSLAMTRHLRALRGAAYP
ncbi:MAG: tRNA-uridine aminocarboxypropyltransferase [Myxococcota bacterium]